MGRQLRKNRSPRRAPSAGPLMLGVVLALALGACGTPRETTVAMQNGITLIAPHGEVVDTVTPHRLTYVAGPWRIDVRDGELFLNREPLGTVQPGDLVRLTASGIVTVNGQRRSPADGDG